MDFVMKDNAQRLVGGIVYEVGAVDSQGDGIDDPAEIWQAMESFARIGMPMKVQHRGRTGRAVVVEQFQPTEDIRKDGHLIPAGAWWLCVKVLDDRLWAAIKSGEINGFSMAGRCRVHQKAAAPETEVVEMEISADELADQVADWVTTGSDGPLDDESAMDRERRAALRLRCPRRG